MHPERGNKIVSCPVCKSPVEWSAREYWKPFCSERCKLIDLGAWFDESNCIPDGQSTGLNSEDN